MRGLCSLPYTDIPTDPQPDDGVREKERASCCRPSSSTKMESGVAVHPQILLTRKVPDFFEERDHRARSSVAVTPSGQLGQWW